MKLLTKAVNFVIGLAQKTGGEVSGEKTSAPELVSAARRLAAEGIVLLKNDNAVLPLSTDDTIAVFGRVQLDWFYVGYGSGGDVKAPYRVNLIDGLQNAGVKLDESLLSTYRAWTAANIPDEGFWGHWPLNFPEMKISRESVHEAAARANKAIVVIGRAAGEDRDQKLKRGGFLLTRAEEKLLDAVTAEFKNVIVLINNGNIMDLSWAESYGDKISSLAYVWQGGMESGNAVADVLTGKVNPSGRLPDTIAKSYFNYPSCDNFGALKVTYYIEDIFVGYRWFETFAPDKVLYPFGHGLSYTSFSEEFEASLERDKIAIKVTVTNTGSRAGQNVTGVYFSPPQGALGKPQKTLLSFFKTKELAVGESETRVIEADISALSSFDDNNTLGYGAAYVVEAGDYKLYGGINSQKCVFIDTITIDKPFIKKVNRVFEISEDSEFFRVINVNGTITGNKVNTEKIALKERILSAIPQDIPCVAESISFADVQSGKRSLRDFIATLSDADLETLCHGHLKMNSSYGVAGNAGALGGVSDSLREKGVPAAITTDGPSGIRLSSYTSLLPCGTAISSSFNEQLATTLYAEVGREMLAKGSDILLAPGMNIHRSPLCGRNFEYFSEEPLLSGKMAAAVVRGVQSAGVAACPKHFACNNQEHGRNINDSRVSERALREIYLKNFEVCIKESKPRFIMTSYNKINGVYSYHSYDLATTILRKEWGYEGAVMTDWWTFDGQSPDFPRVHGDAYRVRAQVDVLMPGGDRLGRYESPVVDALNAGWITRGEMQRSAENVLKFLLECPSTAKKIDSK